MKKYIILLIVVVLAGCSNGEVKSKKTVQAQKPVMISGVLAIGNDSVPGKLIELREFNEAGIATVLATAITDEQGGFTFSVDAERNLEDVFVVLASQGE